MIGKIQNEIRIYHDVSGGMVWSWKSGVLNISFVDHNSFCRSRFPMSSCFGKVEILREGIDPFPCAIWWNNNCWMILFCRCREKVPLIDIQESLNPIVVPYNIARLVVSQLIAFTFLCKLSVTFLHILFLTSSIVAVLNKKSSSVYKFSFHSFLNVLIFYMSSFQFMFRVILVVTTWYFPSTCNAMLFIAAIDASPLQQYFNVGDSVPRMSRSIDFMAVLISIFALHFPSSSKALLLWQAERKVHRSAVEIKTATWSEVAEMPTRCW